MKRLIVQLLVLSVMINAMAACQAPPGTKKRAGAQASAKQSTKKAEETKAATEKKPEIQNGHGSQNTPPPSGRSAEQAQANGDGLRFDVAVNNQDIREFFYGLMQSTGKNIVVHPDVTGRVSLYLQRVTLEQVLSALNDIYGYDYQRNGYGYVVLPTKLNTRVFVLNYLNIQRKGRSSTQVSNGEVTNVKNNENGSNSNNIFNSVGSGSSVSGSTTSNVVYSTAIETRTENDFWKDLKSMLSMMVDTSKGGMVVVNPQSSLVVVRGLPHELRSVDDFLYRTQLSLDRQVVLEAKILEVTLYDSFQAGINWAAIGQLTDNSTISGAISSVPLTNADPYRGIFGVAINSKDFKAVIELLETQGDVSVLSSPRIATVNNQTAAIKVGRENFFVTDIENDTTTTGSAITQSPDITLTPFFSGIVLDVTPQVNGKDDVVLHVHPSVSDVRDQEKTITLGTQELKLPLAASTIREADSVVRAKSNQIVLIGGLMSNVSEERNATVPYMSRLPWLGWLFTQKNEAGKKNELVILLRPIVGEETKTGWSGEELREADKGFTDGSWLESSAL